jgi:hypothetical protein
MVTILLIVIVVLLVMLLMKRGTGSGFRGRSYRNGLYNRPNDNRYDPRDDERYDARYDRPYYDMDGYGPRTGFSGGSFLGGMATGALLTYLFDQGRIDAGQYDYFNNLDQQQMIDELMQQNIIQQDEIDNLQREYDGGNFGRSDNFYDPGNGNGPQDFPDNNSYADNVDYNDFNDDGGFDGGFDGGDFNGGGGDGGWV